METTTATYSSMDYFDIPLHLKERLHAYQYNAMELMKCAYDCRAIIREEAPYHPVITEAWEKELDANIEMFNRKIDKVQREIQSIILAKQN